MSKRESESDYDGPAAKMSRGDDQDEGGASGRSGRVRKKSAKVLEMEEFEQVEKTQQTTKKTKTPKPVNVEEADGSDKVSSGKKAKLIKTAEIEYTPVTSKKNKSSSQLSKALQLAPLPVASSKQESHHSTDQHKTIKTDVGSPKQTTGVSPQDQKSVIKYLLSSPSSAKATPAATKISSNATSNMSDTSPSELTPKKPKKIKKPKADKGAVKVKVKKEKSNPGPTMEEPPQGLKMKIFASSDPNSAQVTLSTQPKPKKSKKHKQQSPTVTDLAQTPNSDSSPPSVTTKKSSKKNLTKKERLIQEAISAAKQMPNLAAMVTSQQSFSASSVAQPAAISTKVKKKKIKSKSVMLEIDSPTDELDHSELMDDEDDDDDDDDEMNLVISENEGKKKKTHTKKKASKEKTESLSPKRDKNDDKMSKRAPTAYMLFCNTHRPTIVDENPGIEFAAISRKLGEMWQMLSNKQKLQWRRKAQRRRKKSNLISTGKIGKESYSLPQISFGAATSTPVNKISTLIHKAQRLSPEEVPLSPTKAGDQNLSIEPIDVAAHLKLLGESLSIIGMRLQEHKGMIAVQGSLSVLLDSLICACGPLLCLTQQVPGMDGCSPAVHSQTLDSVAYVMPGL
ncbi:HMG box-containing protein 4 [Biomphalaria pfeifferi]|uniref:HMG box-containing protein 4 n=1 Tax=Biomphalaria pfeifferi TaxID=112525 RepID=A0AAD8BCW3_BIOPF|nr:HMG box-containing protein 4 [Biomphalaria pfeifferi]